MAAESRLDRIGIMFIYLDASTAAYVPAVPARRAGGRVAGIAQIARITRTLKRGAKEFSVVAASVDAMLCRVPVGLDGRI